MSRIAILAGVLACPLCEDEPLHQIDDHEFGCDKCKNTFYISTQPPESVGGMSKTDKYGNPLFPEEIL